jgi:hypothetical protein
MSHEEKPNFLKILEDIKSCSTDTTPNKTGWENKTQEEIIDDIRHGAAELYRRGIIDDPVKHHEHQLSVIKSLEDWHSGKIKPFSDPPVTIDSILSGTYIPAPILSDQEQFAKAAKFLWGSMKDTIQNYVNPIMKELKTQARIEELENILRKHPNRSDVKLELIKLKKTVKPKIGRKKKRKCR